MTQIDALRTRLLESGARFTVVKNTLTRRAAEAAGTEALLALLDGPSAIAFLETDGDMLAAAKALADSARETNVLEIRGGIMQGRAVTAAEVETLAKLPPVDVLRGQVLGAIVAPLTTFVGLLNAPLQNLVGLVDARIEQLGGEEEAPAEEEAPVEEAPEPEAEAARPRKRRPRRSPQSRSRRRKKPHRRTPRRPPPKPLRRRARWQLRLSTPSSRAWARCPSSSWSS